MTSFKDILDWAERQELQEAQADGLRVVEGGDATSNGGRKSQATKLVDLAKIHGIDLWHDPEQRPWATITVGDHHEHWPLGSGAFRRWLKRLFYEVESKAPGSQAIQDALGVLEGQSLFDGPECLVNTRLAEHEGAIYLDLVNEQWEVVEITPAGWKVNADPPVKFRRARGMLPLPIPLRDGDIKDLRRFVNVTDADWPLVVTWLIAALRPSGPYPILTLHGDQGEREKHLGPSTTRTC